MANAERLSRLSLVEKAVELADAESLESVTVRRLAQELGVTPMALYWHVKSKDQLLVCVADHLLAEVTAEFDPAAPWNARLRVMVEALIGVMRRHRYMPGLVAMVEKQELPSFSRATDTALDLLSQAGFTLREGYAVSTYLLHGAMALVDNEPGCPGAFTAAEATELRRQKRLALERLPADEFPRIVEYAKTMEDEPDLDAYYAFGLDLLMSGVEATAAKRK
ncbi:TetR family transcriptional regulator [Microbispora bryophytorum]|uniref:Putative transcriptional regulator, TetR family (Tetracyclin resistance) n=1 Tax=Microbispora bryophytorum TaxID=1460882 RepID=A0A8H9H7A1_9ACTN|nr:TetR family transcriptional regulator [Microbispora bryophytorum]MBD3139739.1 TetR/AcrR family transcriptional regulator C-terminal domain-containing protein [Microbispora bryophytorum]TQS02706.1 TetR family transcriptional regulator [Microbispora bryophytorum]GGO27563.1 putative transcriptional regulator, TetR family (tetracyclin resistance) [Microbispora bryophytorum]